MTVPARREFGWPLKPSSSCHFVRELLPTGQLLAVVNHSLVRGISCDMLLWWFRNFANLRVRLEGVPDHEGQRVPAYHLWHPVDHVNVRFVDGMATDGTLQPGGRLHVREALQADVYGLRYAMDETVHVPYLARDGMSMNKLDPSVGSVFFHRTHFCDVWEGGELLGVHYHSETVAGCAVRDRHTREVNRKVHGKFSAERLGVARRHIVEEVGAYEHFLPVLYAQRHAPDALHYSPDMAPSLASAEHMTGFDRPLTEARLADYRVARDAYECQNGQEPSFLTAG